VRKIQTLGNLLLAMLVTSGCQTLRPGEASPDASIPTPLAVAAIEAETAPAPARILPGGDFDALAALAEREYQALAAKRPPRPAEPVEVSRIDDIRQQVDAALQQENNAWTRLQNGMRMKPVLNARVREQLDWYLSHREYLNRVMHRAKPVLPFILDVLEEYDIPSEMALLPIVESAYQAFAYSHGRASGMWQIIPSTGRHLGLKQNWWYDGRRDIIESTRAAARYLKELAGQFDGDWELALAAYNAGPGKIRSVRRYNRKKNRPTDFWSLKKLRRETRDYVPKLMALKEIFQNPRKYEIDLLHIEDERSYAIVELDSQIDLALAADLAGISTEELYQLNPAFNRWATPPEGPHRLLLPRESMDRFNEGLAKLPKSKRINWVRYKIRRGDTLSQIADRHRTTARLIRKVNGIRGNNIRAGKYLLIPTATRSLKQYTLSQNARLNRLQNTPRGSRKITHQVRKGESFWSISRKYGVSTRSLARWNGMAPIDTLRVGQKLVIWKRGKAQARRVSLLPQSPASGKLYPLRYTVRKGDSLSRIANKFNIRVADIRKWNRLGKYLQPGQKLKLYVDITRQSG
jgi:membrane-bound lytic murein transglycosylase D